MKILFKLTVALMILSCDGNRYGPPKKDSYSVRLVIKENLTDLEINLIETYLKSLPGENPYPYIDFSYSKKSSGAHKFIGYRKKPTKFNALDITAKVKRFLIEKELRENALISIREN